MHSRGLAWQNFALPSIFELLERTSESTEMIPCFKKFEQQGACWKTAPPGFSRVASEVFRSPHTNNKNNALRRSQESKNACRNQPSSAAPPATGPVGLRKWTFPTRCSCLTDRRPPDGARAVSKLSFAEGAYEALPCPCRRCTSFGLCMPSAFPRLPMSWPVSV